LQAKHIIVRVLMQFPRIKGFVCNTIPRWLPCRRRQPSVCVRTTILWRGLREMPNQLHWSGLRKMHQRTHRLQQRVRGTLFGLVLYQWKITKRRRKEMQSSVNAPSDETRFSVGSIVSATRLTSVTALQNVSWIIFMVKNLHRTNFSLVCFLGFAACTTHGAHLIFNASFKSFYGIHTTLKQNKVLAAWLVDLFSLWLDEFFSFFIIITV